MRPPYGTPLKDNVKMMLKISTGLLQCKNSLIVSFAALNTILLFWYIFFGYQNNFHSDSAAQLLLAVESIKTGDYFVRDWNYVNGDIWTLYNHTFMIPMVLIGGEGYFSFALSRIVPALLLLTGCYLVSTLITKSKSVSLTSTSIVAGGISPWMAENLYGQISYGTYFYISCFLVYFSWKYLESERREINAWLVGIAVICTLCFWTNPSRSTLTYFVPLFASLLNTVQLKNQSQLSIRYRKPAYLAATLFLSSFVGYLLYVTTLRSLNPPTGYVDLKWLSFPEILNSVGHTLNGFFGIFGAIPETGLRVRSSAGYYEGLRLFTGLILLFTLPYSIYRAFSHQNRSVIFVTTFTTCSFLIALSLHLTTSLPNMTDPVGSSRYLVPSVLLMTIIFTCTLDSLFQEKRYLTAIAGLFAVIILTTSGYHAYVRKKLNFEKNHFFPSLHDNYKAGLANFLLSKDLHYGYATFWNSGVTSVLSSGKVKVRQVLLDNGLPKPYRWLSSDSWYEPESWTGKTFIAISNSEEAQIDWAKLEKSLGHPPVETLSFEDKKIYVFSDNALARLPGWSLKFRSAQTFYPDDGSLKQIGVLQENPKNSRLQLVARKGEVGFLHFGPYVPVEPGSYEVAFDVELPDATSRSVRLDISSESGRKILGESELPNSSSSSTINIKVDKQEDLEFRVYSHGASTVIFKGVSITRHN